MTILSFVKVGYEVTLIDYKKLIAPGGSGSNQPTAVTITGGPSGTIDYDDVTFSWSGSDPDGDPIDLCFTALDDPTPNQPTSANSATYNNVSEGSHTFYVRARDVWHAYGEAASRSFTYNAGNHSPVLSNGYVCIFLWGTKDCKY